MKKVLAPKSMTVPHSVIDGFGNEITDEANIRSEYKNEFKHRLRAREIDGQLKEVETMQNHRCQVRLLKSRTEASPNFSMEEFDKVIGELKSGKSADPTGLIREVFKNGEGEGGGGAVPEAISISEDECNKKNLHFFSTMESKIVKKKNGPLNNLESYRDIFLVSILGLIFETLLKIGCNLLWRGICPSLKLVLSKVKVLLTIYSC